MHQQEESAERRPYGADTYGDQKTRRQADSARSAAHKPALTRSVYVDYEDEQGLHSQQQGYAAGDASPADDEAYSQEGYDPGANPHAPAYIPTGATVYHGYYEAVEEEHEQQASTRAKTDVKRGNRQPPATMTIRPDQRSSSGIQQGYNAAARDDCRRRALSGRQSDKQAYEDAPSTRPIKPDKGSTAAYRGGKECKQERAAARWGGA